MFTTERNLSQSPLTIKLVQTNKEIPVPSQAHDGEWYDVYAAEEKIIHAGEYSQISLGIITELPMGYEAHLAVRSSTPKKFGIRQANAPGIIDQGYRGVWQLAVTADRQTVIRVGDRIAQFRLEKVQPPSRIKVLNDLSDLASSERAEGGFGSTDKQA